MIFIKVILGIIGLICLLKGADLLVDAAVDISLHFKIPKIIIGLTLVAFGTSLPEFFVSLFSVLSNGDDIAVGNIVGSNIVNIALIIGLGAIIYPIVVKPGTLIYESPFLLAATFVFIIASNDKNILNLDTYTINYIDSIFFLGILVLFLSYIFKIIHIDENKKKEYELETGDTPRHSIGMAFLYFSIGAILLVIGGKLFVNALILIGTVLNMSQKNVGILIASISTSLPELFTTVVAALKKKSDIALGNVIGSNIFNITVVMGVIGLVKTISVNPQIVFFDQVIMLLFTFIFIFFATTGKKIQRIEGIILVSLYIVYLIMLFNK